MAFDVKKIRLDFPLLNNVKEVQGHPLVFFDNAATSLKPQSVIDAMNEYYYSYTANTGGRGDYDLAFIVDEKFEESRGVVASFIHANQQEVVFTSGASMSLNMIAYGYAMKFLQKGDEILLTEAEHASNVLPWFHVAEKVGAIVSFIPLNEEGRLTPESLRKVISSKTKIVAVADVTNVLAFHLDIQELVKITHEFGAIIVVDGAQSVPHRVIDVRSLDLDFLVFSAHKMLGPTGVGALYGKYALLEKMDPLLTGGGNSVSFDMCGNSRLMKPPHKFEAGTQNIAGVIGFAAAIRYLNKIGMAKIEKYERELRSYALKKMKKLKNVIIYNENAEGSIITFNVKNVFAEDASTYFNSKGICLRSGQHCARILIDFLGTVSTLRASFYFYNTKEEIDQFVDAIKGGSDFLSAYLS